MKITLIGMSGSGKSYWSKKLEAYGFKRFCCDDLIEEKLGIKDVAKWLGQPYDAQYKTQSKVYLQFEKEVMNKFIATAEKSEPFENIVIDTTGSVVYLGEEIIKRLGKLTKIIYLETPLSIKEKMYRLYLKNPKPVIWGKSFKKSSHETNLEALAKNYPNLLSFRAKRYKKYADVILDYHFLHEDNFTLEKFMEAVK